MWGAVALGLVLPVALAQTTVTRCVQDSDCAAMWCPTAGTVPVCSSRPVGSQASGWAAMGCTCRNAAVPPPPPPTPTDAAACIFCVENVGYYGADGRCSTTQITAVERQCFDNGRGNVAECCNSLHVDASISIAAVRNSCPPGAFIEQFNNNECRECPAGTFQPLVGALSCTACPAGKFTAVGGAPVRPAPSLVVANRKGGTLMCAGCACACACARARARMYVCVCVRVPVSMGVLMGVGVGVRAVAGMHAVPQKHVRSPDRQCGVPSMPFRHSRSWREDVCSNYRDGPLAADSTARLALSVNMSAA